MAYKRKTTRVTRATRRTETYGGKTKTSHSTGYSTGAASSTRVTTSYDTKGNAKTTITKRFGNGWLERKTIGNLPKHKKAKNDIDFGVDDALGLLGLALVLGIVWAAIAFWKYILLVLGIGVLVWACWRMSGMM